MLEVKNVSKQFSAMPPDLTANWMFKMLPLRDGRAYAVARRRAAPCSR